MLGIRLSLSPLVLPLRQGSKLPVTGNPCAPATPRRCCRRSQSVPRDLVIRTRATSTGARQSSEPGFGRKPRERRKGERARLAFGGAAALAATASLVKEGHLPESFAEWDDKLEWEEVHDMAQLSNMTNKSPFVVAKWFECHGYAGSLVVRNLPEVATRYFTHVGHLPGQEDNPIQHVAIRGTVSLTDLSIDLKTRQVYDNECGCFFHEGFKEVADAVADDMEQFLEPGVDIKVAGHSLGGAVAVIVAAKLKHRGYNVLPVMTFGAPMFTDARGAAKLRHWVQVMRVTHETDPVPLVPFNKANVLPGDEWRVRRARQNIDASHDGPIESLGDAGGAASSRAYAHFGSQLVLLRRKKCIECHREEKLASASAESLGRLRRRPTNIGDIVDMWGLPLGLENARSAGFDFQDCGICEHCPSRGTSYYFPEGSDACFFDSAWLRLSNINFTHRMNHYEMEVANRLEHHQLRDRRDNDVPPATAGREAQTALSEPQ